MDREEINQEISAILTLLRQLPEEKIREVREFVTWVVEKPSEKEVTTRFSQFAGILSVEEANRIKQAIEEGCERIYPDEW